MLFSLGTLAMYSPCRNIILSGTPSVHSIFEKLNPSSGHAHSKDETVLKYLARLRLKLKLDAPTAPTARGHSSASGSVAEKSPAP